MQQKSAEEKENKKKTAKRQATKRWAGKNPEKIRKKDIKYRAALTEDKKILIRLSHKKWRLSNKEYVRTAHARRRALKQGNGGVLSRGIVKVLLEKQKGFCIVCKKKLNDKYHLDHIVPLAKGGQNSDDNVQLLCPPCNLSKGAKDPIEFMQSKGFLL